MALMTSQEICGNICWPNTCCCNCCCMQSVPLLNLDSKALGLQAKCIFYGSKTKQWIQLSPDSCSAAAYGKEHESVFPWMISAIESPIEKYQHCYIFFISCDLIGKGWGGRRNGLVLRTALINSFEVPPRALKKECRMRCNHLILGGKNTNHILCEMKCFRPFLGSCPRRPKLWNALCLNLHGEWNELIKDTLTKAVNAMNSAVLLLITEDPHN